MRWKRHPAAFSPADAGAERLPGDGAPDLVVGSPFSNAVEVYDGDLSGPVHLTHTWNAEPGSECGYHVATEDLDGDGAEELLVGCRGAYVGTGTLYRVDTPIEPTTLLYGPDLVRGWGYGGEDFEVTDDITGDGVRDLLTTDYDLARGYIRVMDADFRGLQVLESTTTWIHGEAIGTIGLSFSAARDLTGDGVPDVWAGTNTDAWYDGHPGDAVLVAGPLDGAYEVPEDADVWVHSPETITPLLGAMADTVPDLDGDGLDEAIVNGRLGRLSGDIFAFSGAIEGNLDESDATIVLQGALVFRPGRVEAGDYNGDGLTDHAVGEGSGTEATRPHKAAQGVLVYYGPLSGMVSRPRLAGRRSVSGRRPLQNEGSRCPIAPPL